MRFKKHQSIFKCLFCRDFNKNACKISLVLYQMVDCQQSWNDQTSKYTVVYGGFAGAVTFIVKADCHCCSSHGGSVSTCKGQNITGLHCGVESNRRFRKGA